jgi:hypothetical protein
LDLFKKVAVPSSVLIVVDVERIKPSVAIVIKVQIVEPVSRVGIVNTRQVSGI